ncbi:hypothetical protein FW778_00480 [Ginsengibacter hankyongi]|uniref:Cellulase Ig-like domain-containing protein n=1 Tax=Ginsengibacter hankyongi TaxID=2607284 RepID=A0A5J5IQK4_9BACT|nr:hypothetical protein FW778_00480 [Ginsengibacter hankyongi]
MVIFILLFAANQSISAQQSALKRVLVNQAGYNSGESKRFVAWGIADKTGFEIVSATTGKTVFKGIIKNYSGDFSLFNPVDHVSEYIIKVNGLQSSVPFKIAPFYLELISSKLAYDFFVDVRGSTDPVHSNEAKVYGGGPSRDCGAYGLETVFETMFYASNPALFDNWKNEMGEGKMPDLVALILWHAEFAYNHINYNGPVAERHGWLGYKDSAKMNYDYWNTLDQLAAVCAAYHSFLKPYLSAEKYQAYRKVCLEKWTAYDRHKVVRYWTYSTKWVDSGYQEFNEMGNAFGQSVFSNLFMYLCEKNEADGKPEQFLKWAQLSAEDIIKNWDFNNPRHMWWIRNAEHITPQALAFFLLTVPDKAPKGTKEKLTAWANHISAKTTNPWQYRVHNDTERAHPKTKELGGAPALGGSLFAAAYLLNQPQLRELAWSQVNFVFGLNPLGAHLSNKSKERVALNGYWEGVEYGWPDSHPNGYGQLGLVRGTLDGTPLDKDFPRMNQKVDGKMADTATDKIGKNAYATEGWAISNRGWMATLTFSSLHSTAIYFVNAAGKKITHVGKLKKVFIRLKAPLNLHPDKVDEAWVELKEEDAPTIKYQLKETGPDTGTFSAAYTPGQFHKVTASYGYSGFKKQAVLEVKK